MEHPDDGTGTGDISDAQDYYLSLGDVDVQRAFHCLDNPSRLDEFMEAVQSASSSNFVVDFSDDTAWSGFDLPPKAISCLLDANTPRTACLNARWINIWYPFHNKLLLEALARRYDFSPRLLALMVSDPRQPRYSPSRSTITKSTHKRSRWGRKLVTFEIETDAEKASQDELSEHSSIASKGSTTRGNLYKLASDIWHYSSIDFGRNYVCLGYNSLYGTRSASASRTDVNDNPEHLPHCTRVWTWLLLCDDNTVVSINEDPYPYAANGYTSFQHRVLMETRRNLVNVFRSLSTVSSTPLLSHNPLTLLPIRTRLGDTPEETAHRGSDAAPLLFYYLFENFHNSYTLITRKESRYGSELSSLRDSMFEQPKLEHIDRLDRIGKELGVLRRHYESYNRLVDRLLEPQLPTAASLQNSQVVGSDDSASLSTLRPHVSGPIVREKDSLLGVSLSSAARARFKRFRDLIDLYALSEVEEYIKQKDSLVSMNFSLIAMKQSLDVDRLSRITLLLTKATILFLPVSFMSGYFSVPLRASEQVEYSVREYWISFAVVLFCSWLALVVFGVMNGNVQTIDVVNGLWRSVGWTWTNVLKRKGKKKGDREMGR